MDDCSEQVEQVAIPEIDLPSREQSRILLDACRKLPFCVVTNTRDRLIDPGELPKWLGRSFDEVTGRPFVEFLHSDDRTPSAQTLAVPDRHVLVLFSNRWLSAYGRYRTLIWASDHWQDGVGVSHVYLGDDVGGAAKSVLESEFLERERLGKSETLWHGEPVMQAQLERLSAASSAMVSCASRTLSGLQEFLRAKESRRGIREAIERA